MRDPKSAKIIKMSSLALKQSSKQAKTLYNHLDSLVPAARSQFRAIWAKSNGIHPPGMSLQSFRNLAGCEIPNLRKSSRFHREHSNKAKNRPIQTTTIFKYLNDLIRACGSQFRAIWTKSNGQHPIGMPLEICRNLAGCEIPNLRKS